ncbi:MAG: large subunit ribosomal protein L24 [Hyphomicrobiaceae bacterium]|jgi:large subunit ribosomal protein L24
MPKSKIQKDDNVLVITGRERGKTGRIVRVLRKPGGSQVIVERINMVKRHQKPQGQNPGGIVEKEAPLDISNVMLLDPKTNKPTRVGRKHLEEGAGKKSRSVRITRLSGTTLDAK